MVKNHSTNFNQTKYKTNLDALIMQFFKDAIFQKEIEVSY